MPSIVYGEDVGSNLRGISVPNSGHWNTEERLDL
jgi:hypothetical protein